jgi:hypothetical protein
LLNDGGTATYDLTATQALNKNNAPTNSVWDYTVSAADHNVNGLAIVGGNLNGATITDAHGNFPDLSGLFTTFSNLQVATQGIDLTTVAFGAGTTLGYTPNSDNSAGTVSVSDGTHDATISLIGQYAMADFHMASDMHGGTLVSDPSLTGAALTTFLASPHT